MALSPRQERIARLPWVTRLKKSPGRCEGYRYSHMPGYARGRRDVMERWRCKKSAWWRFRGLKKSWAPDGDYCWDHLFSCGLLTMGEEERMRKWLAAHPAGPILEFTDAHV